MYKKRTDEEIKRKGFENMGEITDQKVPSKITSKISHLVC